MDVRGFDNDAHSVRIHSLAHGQRNLLRQPLLHLQPPAEYLHDPVSKEK